MKSKAIAYLLLILLGFTGAHKYYLDKPFIGLLYLFTMGLFGIGWIIDLFTLSSQVDSYNESYGFTGSSGTTISPKSYIKDEVSDKLVKEMKAKGYSDEDIKSLSDLAARTAKNIYNEKN